MKNMENITKNKDEFTGLLRTSPKGSWDIAKSLLELLSNCLNQE